MKKTKLCGGFSAVRKKSDLLKDIQKDPRLRDIFGRWSPEEQLVFLDICTGERGLQFLRASVFRELFSENRHLLENMISVFLEREVKICAILDEWERETEIIHLTIEDIDTIQKQLGIYYVKDLTKVYETDGMNSDIRIYFVEHSPLQFFSYMDSYIHFGCGMSSGAGTDVWEQSCFICLDVYEKRMEWKQLEDERDIWCSVLKGNSYERLCQAIKKRPVLQQLYDTWFNICLDTKRAVLLYDSVLHHDDTSRILEELRRLNEMNVRLQLELNKSRRQIELLQSRVEEQSYTIADQSEQIYAYQICGGDRGKFVAEPNYSEPFGR